MIVESLLSDLETLYFFKQEGCGACEAAAPELSRFMLAHPSMTVLTFDAAGPYPERLGVKIKATPTYVYRRGQAMIATAGAMKAKDLEKWIKKAGGRL